MTQLQRLLLGLEGHSQQQVEEVFDRIVFPLLDELLRPEVYRADPRGVPESRLRACNLLCKAFLQFEIRDGQEADIKRLWMQILDLLDRLMNVDKKDQLVRA